MWAHEQARPRGFWQREPPIDGAQVLQHSALTNTEVVEKEVLSTSLKHLKLGVAHEHAPNCAVSMFEAVVLINTLINTLQYPTISVIPYHDVTSLPSGPQSHRAPSCR